MYISIDTETTGLDPNKDQLLQISAVAWDNDDVMKCSYLDIVVNHSRIHGHPYALRLNSGLIGAIADGVDTRLVMPEAVYSVFKEWLSGLGNHQFFPIAKNYSLDRWFLAQYKIDGLLRHRCLDPGSLYADRNGVPSTPELLDRCKVPFEGELHDALFDARATLYFCMMKLDNRGYFTRATETN